jgi:hypothetical protein
MSVFNKKKQQGFTILEILIGITISIIVLNVLFFILSGIAHKQLINNSANTISIVPIAVQRRNAHDGFSFSLWDTNGGKAATNATISWSEANFTTLLTNYLVGRNNALCGNAATGWNPLNTAGGPDAGDVTSMERTALVGCNQLRGTLPLNIKLSAAMSPDVTSAVSKFSLYINTSNINFGNKNDPTNNILNFLKLSQSIQESLTDSQNGVPNVKFGLPNTLSNLDDDTLFTATECETKIKASAPCFIIVDIDFAGTTNGTRKRTDNQDFFLDDVTFGQSIAAGRQKCAYWEDTAGVWTGKMIDCAIKAGVGDNDVKLVFDAAQASEFLVTNETDLNHLCRVFDVENLALGKNRLIQKAAPNDKTPCGMLLDGSIVQLISDTAHVGVLHGEKIVAGTLYASQANLYSNGNGDIVLRVYNASHTAITYSIDNFGNTIISGKLDVSGDATFNSKATIANTLTALTNVELSMNNGGSILLGSPLSGNSSVTMTRDNIGKFSVKTQGSSFELLAGDNSQGVKLNTSANKVQIKLKADSGVIAENGTTLHASKSTLMNENFSASGVSSAATKSLSELVTADMAKMLDDTSSPVQIVGVDRIEGAFTSLNKPDCLAFMKDTNYSSPAANPYRKIIDAGGLSIGQDYARLLLIPTYIKTYNSAFGDNQIYAQHASHSTPTTWDIFLYLSGEGAFGTGAREDGAGGSHALILCDYSSINFSRQIF